MSIRTLTTEAFHVWTADRGIGPAPQNGPSDRLAFTAGGDADAALSRAASRVPEFVSTLLSRSGATSGTGCTPIEGLVPGREIESEPQGRV